MTIEQTLKDFTNTLKKRTFLENKLEDLESQKKEYRTMLQDGLTQNIETSRILELTRGAQRTENAMERLNDQITDLNFSLNNAKQEIINALNEIVFVDLSADASDEAIVDAA